MVKTIEIPPPPGICQRKNCVTNTQNKPLDLIFDGQAQSYYCKTCGLQMKIITYFIAFSEGQKELFPVSNNGIISLFDTLAEAKNASGFLGVGVATELDGLTKICERFGLSY